MLHFVLNEIFLANLHVIPSFKHNMFLILDKLLVMYIFIKRFVNAPVSVC